MREIASKNRVSISESNSRNVSNLTYHLLCNVRRSTTFGLGKSVSYKHTNVQTIQMFNNLFVCSGDKKNVMYTPRMLSLWPTPILSRLCPFTIPPLPIQQCLESETASHCSQTSYNTKQSVQKPNKGIQNICIQVVSLLHYIN